MVLLLDFRLGGAVVGMGLGDLVVEGLDSSISFSFFGFHFFLDMLDHAVRHSWRDLLHFLVIFFILLLLQLLHFSGILDFSCLFLPESSLFVGCFEAIILKSFFRGFSNLLLFLLLLNEVILELLGLLGSLLILGQLINLGLEVLNGGLKLLLLESELHDFFLSLLLPLLLQFLFLLLDLLQLLFSLLDLLLILGLPVLLLLLEVHWLGILGQLGVVTLFGGRSCQLS